MYLNTSLDPLVPVNVAVVVDDPVCWKILAGVVEFEIEHDQPVVAVVPENVSTGTHAPVVLVINPAILVLPVPIVPHPETPGADPPPMMVRSLISRHREAVLQSPDPVPTSSWPDAGLRSDVSPFQ